MNQTPTQSEDRTIPIRIDGRQFYDGIAQLCEIAEQNLTRAEYFGRCFEVIGKQLDASLGLMNLRIGPKTIERTFKGDDESSDNWPGDNWLDAIDNLVLRAQTDETALIKTYRSQSGDNVAYALAAPIITLNGRSIGSIAFLITNPNFEQSDSELVQITQMLELVSENAPIHSTGSKSTDQHTESATLTSVVRASDYRSIRHLSFAIVNSLCGKFRCEQVAIGLVKNRDVRLLAVSGLNSIPKNTPGMLAVQQSMAVCLDRKQPTVVQSDGKIPEQLQSSNCQVHHFWHRLTGESCVATIPLQVDDQTVAVLSIRRRSGEPFLQDDIDRIRMLAESFAPALPLVDRASRSIVRHFWESTVALTHQVFSWHKIGQKAAILCFCAFVAWFIFGTTQHQILAPCKIVPDRIFTVSAPYESMIEQVHVLPGQVVKEGDLLVQLNTKDLLIERKRIATAIASTQIEANAYLSDRKPDKAFLKQAEIAVLQTDLDLVETQIRRSTIRAHEDGVVMPTEIHRRIGQFVALGEPLLEIANENNWRLQVEVPENNAQYIDIAQQGHFQTAARPDERLMCEVTKISPSSEVMNERNVVVAEAFLLERDPWMKVGMEGHIRIRAGKKPVWWVYCHPVIDLVRLKLWL